MKSLGNKQIPPSTIIERRNASSNPKGTSNPFKLQEMQNEINHFFFLLKADNAKFDSKNAFSCILNYIEKYERVLYSEVSVLIYSLISEGNDNQNNTKCDRFGTLLSNIEALVDYAESVSNTTLQASSQTKGASANSNNINNTKRAIIKLWDHVNLAQRQYNKLRQSDSEYEEKFEKSIVQFQSKIVGEMNAQLLSMVGIFTALAFILFGGISSLDNVLSELKESHILLLLIVGVGWGIGILNVTFIFLFCIGKMTRLNFKSNQQPEASFFQRYPVVCWTNFILFSLLFLLLWHFYCYQKGIMLWYEKFIVLLPKWGIIIEFWFFFFVILLLFLFLVIKTKTSSGNEDE